MFQGLYFLEPSAHVSDTVLLLFGACCLVPGGGLLVGPWKGLRPTVNKTFLLSGVVIMC